MTARLFRKSWWVDFRHAGRRYRKRSPLNTKAGAQTYEATLRGALARGEDISGPGPGTEAFAAFARRWYGTHVRTNNRPSTARAAAGSMRRYLLPAFGGLPLREVTAAKVEGLKRSLVARGLHPKTVNNHLGFLRKCLKCAVEWDALPQAPKVAALKSPPPPLRWLSREEQARLLAAACDEPLWRPMVLLALRGGLRVGELLGLDWEDVDWGRRQLTVRRNLVKGVLGATKSNRIRHVPLTRDVLAALAAIRAPEGPVFRGPDGGRRTDRACGAAIGRLMAAAQVPWKGWHVLRHTYATDLAACGTPLHVVKELMGHADINMTMRYAHVAPGMMRAAVDAVEKAFGEGAQGA